MKWLVGGINIWWPVAVVLLAAVSVIVSGIWGTDFVDGNTDAFSNAIRSLQWETMAAGLFGLTGGCLVLVATRQQIEHVKSHAIEQAVDQELSVYFQVEADIRYLLEDFKNIIEAAQTWEEAYDEDDLSSTEIVSFLTILRQRAYKMFRDESTPLVFRKELRFLLDLANGLQRKNTEFSESNGEETIDKVRAFADRFHEVVAEHRKRLIHTRLSEFDKQGVHYRKARAIRS